MHAKKNEARDIEKRSTTEQNSKNSSIIPCKCVCPDGSKAVPNAGVMRLLPSTRIPRNAARLWTSPAFVCPIPLRSGVAHYQRAALHSTAQKAKIWKLENIHDSMRYSKNPLAQRISCRSIAVLTCARTIIIVRGPDLGQQRRVQRMRRM